jgi:CheY-like chemotaxis protein
MTVLYVDDDIEDMEIFKDAIHAVDPSIQLIPLSSAKDAITYLNNGALLPDNIFLDINMPGMDGKACLEEIRRNKKFDHIKVYIYSTNTFPRDIDHIESLNARFLKKANSFNELCDIIRSLGK